MGRKISRGRAVSVLGWLVGPERLAGIAAFTAAAVWGVLADLPALFVAVAALVALAAGTAIAHYSLALRDRLKASNRPNIIAHDPESFPGRLATGELFFAVKIPFANLKPRSGRGVDATGFYAEFRVLDPAGHAAIDWTQARWDEAKQQHERGPGASLTSLEVRTIKLEPNGLKHYLETVIQIQNVPPGGGYLEPWTQAGRSGVGIKSPVIVEVRWECNELGRKERHMHVEASEPPGLDPKATWID
jgi:hypothetical protein